MHKKFTIIGHLIKPNHQLNCHKQKIPVPIQHLIPTKETYDFARKTAINLFFPHEKIKNTDELNKK